MRKLKNLYCTVFIVFSSLLLRAADSPMIIDHHCRTIEKIPQEWVERAKTDLHIAYGHTSHGSQLITGMSGLIDYKGPLYSFNKGGAGGALDLTDRPFSGASDLGNPNRTAWAAATRDYLDSHGECNVIIWSWCGQVSNASENDIDIYVNLMEALETDYPSVQFVYMTGHLNGTGLEGNLHIRNEQIRNFCRTNNKILFDFADIETYDPGGVYFGDKFPNDNCDYDSDGNGTRDRNWAVDWQDAHPGEWYQCSSAHSQPLNANLKAYAAWWLWASLAGWDGEYRSTASQVIQHGITWTFDKEYEVGQFVNGDWWVVGPCTVVSVNPSPTGSGETARHGSMVNPVISEDQGYDGRAINYNESLAVSYPLVLQPDQSLVSTESRPEDDVNREDLLRNVVSLGRTKLLRAAVLTCVKEPVSENMFRPPYCGSEKPLFDYSKIHADLLPTLAPPDPLGNFVYTLPDGKNRCQQFVRYFERPWIMHQRFHFGQHIRPLENCPCYYREAYIICSDAAMLALLDLPDRMEVVKHVIQHGIDTYYCIQTFPNPDGRHDRCLLKWPIIFAGILLDNDDMKHNINYPWFKTDSCTYYGKGWNGATALWGGEYGIIDPEYRYEHLNPFTDGWNHKNPGGVWHWKTEGYRRATHSWPWIGIGLAGRIMHAEEIYNHNPFFDYVDRWMTQEETWFEELKELGNNNPCGDGTSYASGAFYEQGFVSGGYYVHDPRSFTQKMWDLYRGNLPDPPEPDPQEPQEPQEPEDEETTEPQADSIPETIKLTVLNNLIKPQLNQQTIINCDMPEDGGLTVTVFDSNGKEILILVNEDKVAGTYQVFWDGKYSTGKTVGSGIYLVRMESGSFTETKKIVVVK
ncbi:MAG: T9SS type A sorting domain-containing protein [Elusimicrobia bacterium]|nr:T9SS type A sorting domain-containing protein [Elusimicrobiota bacterium]